MIKIVRNHNFFLLKIYISHKGVFMGNNIIIEDSVKIGKNVTILSGNILKGNTIIGVMLF